MKGGWKEGRREKKGGRMEWERVRWREVGGKEGGRKEVERVRRREGQLYVRTFCSMGGHALCTNIKPA